MTRLYGRAQVGARCLGCVPHGHWSTATFISALRHDRISAPLLIDAPMDGAMFLAYVERILAPELRREEIVICDNLSSHKVKSVKGIIQDCGAQLLYLPAYSPDFNPIELMWSKVKSFLRGAKARIEQELWTAIAKALAAITPGDARAFFCHCGVGMIN